MKISPTSMAKDGEGSFPSPSRRARPLRAALMLVLGIVLGAAAVWLALGDSAERVPAEAPPSFDLLSAAPPPADVAPSGTRQGAVPGIPPVAAKPSPTAPSPSHDGAEPIEGPVSAAPIEDVESLVAPPPSRSPESSAARTAEVTSGLLENYAPDEKLRPVRLLIPSLDVDAPINAVGYDRRKDEMEIPRTASIAGWYEYGPSPGEAGSSVISAHVDWAGKKGVFFELRNIQPNALIVVEYEDGSQRKFSAAVRNQYDKDELPVDEIFARTGRPILTLITCGGAFNPSINSYQDNVVVQAVDIVETENRT